MKEILLFFCQQQMIKGMDTLMSMFKISDIQGSSFKLRNKEEIHQMQLIFYTT
jgi:hypothetical protein